MHNIKKGDRFLFGSYRYLTFVRREEKYIIALDKNNAEVSIFHKLFDLYAHRKDLKW